MKNDLYKTFGQIFDGDIAALRAQLIDIQDHQADREEAQRWVERLRFLDIANVPSLQSRGAQRRRLQPLKSTCDIPVSERRHDDGDSYIAVSWKWLDHSEVLATDSQKVSTFKYMIQRPGVEPPHKSDFPDHYLDRVIMFAQAKNITKLWIDTECIYQKETDDPRDKELGVQIMDVVYGESAAPVGLLTATLTKQDEIHTLTSLLSGIFFVDPKDEDNPRLSPGVNVHKVQTLLSTIFDDPRWSRGWIFQEDHLASDKMILLIPYNDVLDMEGHYDFGDTPGQLQVNLAEFKQAVTMFCLATPEDEHIRLNSDFLSKAKQYRIWNKIVRPSPQHSNGSHLWSEGIESSRDGARLRTNSDLTSTSFYPSMTNSVLDDISNRFLKKEEDRIAILANALRFSKRLDISQDSPIMKSSKYSLSVALLALIFINGEILYSDYKKPISSVDLMHCTLKTYLKRCEFTVNAPRFKLEQSFVNKCRFKSPTITNEGIETRGFLFKLLSTHQERKRGGYSEPLAFNNRDRKYLSGLSQDTHRSRKLSVMAEKAIGILIARLEETWINGRLARYLKKHLELDRIRQDAKPSTPYVLDMMAAISRALLDRQQLRLACLASAQDYAEPSAIFIAPEPGAWSTDEDGFNHAAHDMRPSVKVFTSWDGGRNPYDRERFVSFEAKTFSERDGSHRYEANVLKSCSWVNGVWDVRGKEMGTYYFPLPGITEVPDNEAAKREPKRVRSFHENSCGEEESQGHSLRRRFQ